ncbi:hypothetical protein AAC387_Pa08g2482 [Persea americana]
MEMEKRRTRRREEKRRSTTDNLSDDLMVEILRLLPLNSIVQCRNVCKRWQSLTNYFLTNPFNVAASYECYLHNYECMERAQRGGILQISDLDLRINFRKEGPNDSRILSSCNGLFFCAYLRKKPFLVECYIFNPWTKDIVPLPKPRGLRRIDYRCNSLCGLAVENHSRDNNNNNNVALYKIVMAHEHRYHGAYKFEIYSPDVKRWLTLDRATERHRCRGRLDKTAVYCNRVLYWRCSENDHALFFNLETEASGYLDLPREEEVVVVDDDDAITDSGGLIECDGHLHYIRIGSAGSHRLIVWKMCTTSCQWLILHNIDLTGVLDLNLDFFPLRRKNRVFPILKPIYMSCKGCDKVLFTEYLSTSGIKSYSNRRIVSYDLKSGVFELELVLNGFCSFSWMFFRYNPTTMCISER